MPISYYDNNRFCLNWITLSFFNLCDIKYESRLKATRVIDPDWSVRSQLDISPEPCVLMKVRFGYSQLTTACIFHLY